MIIATTKAVADATATIDWGWRRYTRGAEPGWLNKNNEFVRYVSDHFQLIGLPRGTKIYFGYGWWDSRAKDYANELIQIGKARMGDADD